MKDTIETKITGWSFIVAAVLLFAGWWLSSHHLGEYIVADDFKIIGEDVWYWIWMYRIHIFGWVIMGFALTAFAILLNQKPYNILIVPSTVIIVIGTFVLALANAFYYGYGAWGVGKTAGMSSQEIVNFMEGITMLNYYASCLLRFGRVFSGLGLVLLGVGLFSWKIMDDWVAFFCVAMGLLAMGIIMLIPENFDMYKPLFHVKVIWLVVMGAIILKKGVRLNKEK